MSSILTKALDPTKVRLIYDDSSNSLLGDMTIQMIKMWIDEYAD